eukprot:6208443-Pleurochrysis_carterae.AAC.1
MDTSEHLRPEADKGKQQLCYAAPSYADAAAASSAAPSEPEVAQKGLDAMKQELQQLRGLKRFNEELTLRRSDWPTSGVEAASYCDVNKHRQHHLPQKVSLGNSLDMSINKSHYLSWPRLQAEWLLKRAPVPCLAHPNGLPQE